MMKMTISGFLIFMVMLIFMLILFIISKKSFMDREKSSPFECGFDPISSSRIPFSLHFFLMAVIFLIFDVEIVLILPISIIIKFSMMIEWFMTSIMFMLIIMMGLYHEWNQGMLNWSY
uniref:NADH dehydrogenase subunit 3 n=1 Tax=Philagra albinotata TaxID=868271 RepID=UPI002551FD91|nr:NADH dehydrogenase subunit 3 [Philagra albinotata]WGL39476.1 NADH dehydrogenase subunit 3 [Philagra albinotata]